MNFGQIDGIEKTLNSMLESKAEKFPGSIGVKLYAEQLRGLATERKKFFSHNIAYNGKDTFCRIEMSNRNNLDSLTSFQSSLEILNNPKGICPRKKNETNLEKILEELSEIPSYKSTPKKARDPKKDFFSLCLKTKLQLPGNHQGQKLSVELLYNVRPFVKSSLQWSFVSGSRKWKMKAFQKRTGKKWSMKLFKTQNRSFPESPWRLEGTCRPNLKLTEYEMDKNEIKKTYRTEFPRVFFGLD